MSHYYLEVIMPPINKKTQDVKTVLSQILDPFSENCDPDDEDSMAKYAFWDFWVIGGRWAGAKIEAMIDPEKRKAFGEELIKRKVTVSGLRAGKETLSPADQIPMVDALWREWFPESPAKSCPLFSHFNDQYANSDQWPDICELKDVPKSLTASRVIFAGPSYKDDKSMKSAYMLQCDFYNGVSWLSAEWKGDVWEAVEQWKNRLSRMNPDYAAKWTPQDNWLAVTVDYHS